MFDVSIIIVTRNTCELTCAAIESVLHSGDSLSKEIIVADNGSTDQTRAVIPLRFPGVRYLRSDANLGFARAVNRAARCATGRYLLLLNSDARPKPGVLATALSWMDANPGCAVAGAQLLNPDGTRQNSIANFPTLATELLNKSLLRQLWPKRYPGKEHSISRPADVESVVGAFFLVRRSVWEELGGFDERYFFFFEETDFCRMATRRGWRVVHLPQVEVWHRQGTTAAQDAAAARIEFWRSRYLYFAKHYRWPIRATLRIGLLVRLIVNWLFGGLICVLTFGKNAFWNARWKTCTSLLWWHVRGCPSSVGLPR